MAHTTSSSSAPSSSGEFGRGKTIFVLAVVVGCFAVLWPKVFYPMFTASIYPTPDMDDQVCCDVISEKDTNAYKIMTEICTNIIRQDSKTADTGQGRLPLPDQGKLQQNLKIQKPTALLCRAEILKTCGVDIIILLQENAAITKEYKESLSQLRSYNTSHCLKMNYGVDFAEIGLPKASKGPLSAPSHMRPERPFRADMVHPALREKGRAIPTPTLPRRTIEREARPGPVPGVRPPVGGAGHVPTAPKGSGTMGIIMPMYTIGIVCFFVYTLMKILFKKAPEEGVPPPPAGSTVPTPGKQPILKDYGMDPEHRKFVFAEEYTAKSEKSLKDEFNKEDRESGIRRKTSTGKGRFHEDKRRLELETEDESPATEEGEQSIGEIDQTVGSQVEPIPVSSADTLSDFDTTAILDGGSGSGGLDKLTDSQRSAMMAKYFADSAATSFSETFSESDVPPMEPQISETIPAAEEETTRVSEDDVKLTIVSDSEPPYPETNEVIESIETPSASTDAMSFEKVGELSDSFSEVKLDTTLSSVPVEKGSSSEQLVDSEDGSVKFELPTSSEKVLEEIGEQTPLSSEAPEILQSSPSLLATGSQQQKEQTEALSSGVQDSEKLSEESPAEIKSTEIETEIEASTKEAEASVDRSPKIVEAILKEIPTREEVPIGKLPIVEDVVPVHQETLNAEPTPGVPSQFADSVIAQSSEPSQVLSTPSDDSSPTQTTELLTTEVLGEPLKQDVSTTKAAVPETLETPQNDAVVESEPTVSTPMEPEPSKEEEVSTDVIPSEPSTPVVMNPPLTLSSRGKSVTQADLTSAALFFDKTIEISDDTEDEQKIPSDSAVPKADDQPDITQDTDTKSEVNEEDEASQTTVTIIEAPEEVKEYAESLAAEILEDAKSTAVEYFGLSLPQPSPAPPPQPEPVVDILVTQPTPTSENDESFPIDPFACVRLSEALLRHDSKETDTNNVTHPSMVTLTNEPEFTPTDSVPVESQISSDSEQAKVARDSKGENTEVTKIEGEPLRGPVVTLAEEGRKNSEPLLCRSGSNLLITPVEDVSGEQSAASDVLGGYVTMEDDSNKPRLPIGFMKQLRSAVEITSFEEKDEDSCQGQEGRESEILLTGADEKEKVSRRVMSMDSSDSVQTVKDLSLQDLETISSDREDDRSGLVADEGPSEDANDIGEIQATVIDDVGQVDLSAEEAAKTSPLALKDPPVVSEEIPPVAPETPVADSNKIPSTHLTSEISSVVVEIPVLASEILLADSEIPQTALDIPAIVPETLAAVPGEVQITSEISPVNSEISTVVSEIHLVSENLTGESQSQDAPRDLENCSTGSDIGALSSGVLLENSGISFTTVEFDASPMTSSDSEPLYTIEILPTIARISSDFYNDSEGCESGSDAKTVETEINSEISPEILSSTNPCVEPMLLKNDLSLEVESPVKSNSPLTNVTLEDNNVALLDLNVGIVNADASPVTCTESIESTPIQPDVVDTLPLDTPRIAAQTSTATSVLEDSKESIQKMNLPTSVAIKSEELQTAQDDSLENKNELNAAAQSLPAEVVASNIVGQQVNTPESSVEAVPAPEDKLPSSVSDETNTTVISQPQAIIDTYQPENTEKEQSRTPTEAEQPATPSEAVKGIESTQSANEPLTKPATEISSPIDKADSVTPPALANESDKTSAQQNSTADAKPEKDFQIVETPVAPAAIPNESDKGSEDTVVTQIDSTNEAASPKESQQEPSLHSTDSPIQAPTLPEQHPEDIDSDSIQLEFETIDPSEINFTLTRAPIEDTQQLAPPQPSLNNGSKDTEIEFIPSAASKSVPPIQKQSESEFQASEMAVESQVIQPQEVETIINRVETPDPSSSLLTSTDLPDSSTTPSSSSSTNNKHVGVMFSLEFEQTAAEDNSKPDANGLVEDTANHKVTPQQQVSSPGEEAKQEEANHKSLRAPIKDEEVLSQQPLSLLPSSEEASKETGQRDRDATVKGILDALAEQTSSTNQSESLPTKSDSEKVQPPEEELEKGKESSGTKESPGGASPKPSGLKSQKSVEKEVKFQLPEDHHHSEEEEPEEEEEVMRPPTPPRTLSKKSKHKSQIPPEPVPSHEVIKYAQVLSGNIMEQSAAAAIAAAKAQSASGGGHKEAVSVVGFEETAELESGGKWGDRTPTPTFRMATPPVPHRPPTPPTEIPSIFLEGPFPTSGQQLMVSDSQVEVEGGDDDDEDNLAAPIVLSGKVTLSVISGIGVDDVTEASSISYDDRAQAGGSSKKAIKAEKGLSSSKKSPVSSPDMEEYEVIKSGVVEYEDDDNDDVDITSYMTAEADVEKVQEDTAGDISEMDGLGKQDDLPQDSRKGEE